jgi:hypothetical protein
MLKDNPYVTGRVYDIYSIILRIQSGTIPPECHMNMVFLINKDDYFCFDYTRIEVLAEHWILLFREYQGL